MIRVYTALILEKRQHQERLHDIEKQLARLNGPIVDALLDEGIENQRIVLDGESYTVYPRTQQWARPTNGDMQALCEVLKEHSPMTGCMVQEKVNLMTLSAWVREQQSNGGVPEDIAPFVEIDTTPVVQVRHASK